MGSGAQVSKDELFSEGDVCAALGAYAASNSLLSNDEAAVKLDRLLLGNLFNKKEEVREGAPHPLQDLQQRLLSKLQLFHRVVRHLEEVRGRLCSSAPRGRKGQRNVFAGKAVSTPWSRQIATAGCSHRAPLWMQLKKSTLVPDASRAASLVLGAVPQAVRVQGPPLEQISKGQVKNISIQTEDRQGGRKHVTKIAHVEAFGLNPEELGGILQRKFQTSSSVQKLPGKNEAGKEISLQGDLLQEVAAFLAASYGIHAQYITVVSKRKAAK